MTKIIAIILFLVIGVLAVQYVDEKTQKKAAIAFGILIAIAVVAVFIMELAH